MANQRIDAALAILAVDLDRRLVWEALQAAGADNDFTGGHRLLEGNKPLAGVGNRVISLVITEKARQEGCTIGDTNTRIQSEANNERLISLCDSNGLTSLIKLSAGASRAATRTKSATVEALVGAAYRHGGVECAAKVMRNLDVI